MRFLNRKLATRQVEQLIRGGVGLRECTLVWLAGDATREAVLDAAVAWIQKACGEMRRPYGVDHVAVALGCWDSRGHLLCTNSLGVVRPGLFYESAGRLRIAAFLDDAATARAREPDGSSRVVVALLSLGDLAYAIDAAAA